MCRACGLITGQGLKNARPFFPHHFFSFDPPGAIVLFPACRNLMREIPPRTKGKLAPTQVVERRPLAGESHFSTKGLTGAAFRPATLYLRIPVRILLKEEGITFKQLFEPVRFSTFEEEGYGFGGQARFIVEISERKKTGRDPPREFGGGSSRLTAK